jgi:ppGpp synthetase/RelA/SpoT-type nucleotidyltranferase
VRTEDDANARAIVEAWRDEHIEPMRDVADVLEAVIPSMVIDEAELVYVTSRSKRFATIIDKLDRGTVKLADMVDLGGVRGVVDTMDDVDATANELRGLLDVRRVRDWARNPPVSGYRAVHLHVRHAGRAVEVQLRTFGQDAWANVVEEESRLSGLDYKSGRGHPEVLALLRAIADFTAIIELGESHPDVAQRMYECYRAAKPLLHFPGFADLDS